MAAWLRVIIIFVIHSVDICHCQHIFANGTRNKYVWPFASDSIWNHPIGSNAVYVDAGIDGTAHFGVDIDIWLITTEDDPTYDWYTPYSWTERCRVGTQYKYPYKVRLPADFIVADADPPHTPNNAAAILLPDGETIVQINPMCRDSVGGAVFGYSGGTEWTSSGPEFVSIYGDGLYGGHSGSGLSSIGGTIRLGELSPDNASPVRGSIRHALKWEFWGKQYYYRPSDISSDPTGCRRWPANRCDSYWQDTSGNGYGGTTWAMRMGSLVAITEDDANTLNDILQTIPGKMILWTMVDYGAYIVDDSAWDQQQFCVEDGVDTQFKDDWGYSMYTGSPFADDMILISTYFKVVNNNYEGNIGGGGTTHFSLPPEIGNYGGTGSSSASSSSGGTLINWSGCNKWWYAVNVETDNYVTKVVIQGSEWGSDWATCGWNKWSGKNVWSCGRVKPHYFDDLPLNIKITDRDGKVSTTYGVITDINASSIFEFNAFGSAAFVDEDADVSNDINGTSKIIASLVICIVGCVIIGLIGYCFVWKKYKNVKFDRNDENKMISKEKEDSLREIRMSEIEIDVEEEVGAEEADEITTNE